MSVFNCLKWPEMRGVALELIASMHEGHQRGRFSIPAVNFVRIFAPGAPEEEMAKVRRRGDIHFIADQDSGGRFTLPEGERATFDLGREGLVMRIPPRMSGVYELSPDAFRIEFNKGEELEGCKRVLLLVCNRVVSVDITSRRVDVRLPSRILDLCVEFE
ncbi:MAG TPA: hypothetical protein VD966_00395 [Pyrinomonadaceae bacterium]|nr:hypothetical protein [Pyrinomonadaceae bacterium]